MKEQLLKKISDKSITAGVVGLGYVGLPLAVEIAKAGFKTTGFDLLDDKVNKINRGENYISDVDGAALRALLRRLTPINSRTFHT